ncbi:MAG: Flp pilus assembly protein CpaB [Salinarimonadaceae bacterium]|nr:MAG: Flp pilus assembly protein CpaB [Salinarimonadaceae bacterium]
MKRAQIVVLGIAVAAGVGAMYLASGSPPPPPPEQPQATVAPAPTIRTTEVLVASVDVPMGRTLSERELRWQEWPADSVPAGLITRRDRPQALGETAGSIARAQILAGEPVRRERLIRSDGGGFMSAILPAGKRAVAISIDTRGASSAGGFILPNDRVDVLRTYRDESSGSQQGSEVQVTETILKNVRVLAIGKNVQTDSQGNSFVDGETATLELTPAQAETVTLAQRVGHVSLALRSLADAETSEDEKRSSNRAGLTVVRYGVSRQTPVQ